MYHIVYLNYIIYYFFSISNILHTCVRIRKST